MVSLPRHSSQVVPTERVKVVEVPVPKIVERTIESIKTVDVQHPVMCPQVKIVEHPVVLYFPHVPIVPPLLCWSLASYAT